MNNKRFLAGSEAHDEPRRAGCYTPFGVGGNEAGGISACDEFNLAKARQLVGVLSGMSAFDAQVVLEIACCLVREEALSTVLMRVPSWAKDFLALWQVPQKPSVEEAHRDFVKQWPGVSVHQVRRFIAKLGTVTRERGRMGAREIKNIRPFIRRDWSNFEPNDAWIADGHTFDAEVQHPLHGRPFRPEITVFIDGGTRRVTGWSLGLAENAIGVADALATGVRLCGLPAIVYGDNGAGYRANLLTDEATGILSRIHASPEFALPYNSQGKGIIERLHRTLWVPAAKELPSYVGACMDKEARLAQFKLTRKALKQGGAMPLIPYDVFVNFIGEKVAIYNARPHRSLGMISPDSAWASWMARGWKAERLTEKELVDFFRPRIERTVVRRSPLPRSTRSSSAVGFSTATLWNTPSPKRSGSKKNRTRSRYQRSSARSRGNRAASAVRRKTTPSGGISIAACFPARPSPTLMPAGTAAIRTRRSFAPRKRERPPPKGLGSGPNSTDFYY